MDLTGCTPIRFRVGETRVVGSWVLGPNDEVIGGFSPMTIRNVLSGEGWDEVVPEGSDAGPHKP